MALSRADQARCHAAAVAITAEYGARIEQLPDTDVRYLPSGTVHVMWPTRGWLPVQLGLLPPTGTDPARLCLRMDRQLTAEQATQLATMLGVAAEWREAMVPFDPPEQGTLA